MLEISYCKLYRIDCERTVKQKPNESSVQWTLKAEHCTSAHLLVIVATTNTTDLKYLEAIEIWLKHLKHKFITILLPLDKNR